MMEWYANCPRGLEQGFTLDAGDEDKLHQGRDRRARGHASDENVRLPDASDGGDPGDPRRAGGYRRRRRRIRRRDERGRPHDRRREGGAAAAADRVARVGYEPTTAGAPVGFADRRIAACPAPPVAAMTMSGAADGRRIGRCHAARREVYRVAAMPPKRSN